MEMKILDSNFNVLAEYDNPHREKVRAIIYRTKKIGCKKPIEKSVEARFNQLYNQWWEETCVFSGQNFYASNPNFKEMLKMGNSILPFIKNKMQSEPQYKQKALKWLLDAVETQ